MLDSNEFSRTTAKRRTRGPSAFYLMSEKLEHAPCGAELGNSPAGGSLVLGYGLSQGEGAGEERLVLFSPLLRVCHTKWKHKICRTGNARRSMTHLLMLPWQQHGFSGSVSFPTCAFFPVQALAPCVHLTQSFLGHFKQIWCPVL